MAALDRLFEDGTETERGQAKAGSVVAPRLGEYLPAAEPQGHDRPRSVSALPLLPLPDVPRPEQAPARFLMTSERDREWQDEHESWMGQRDRDVALYGSVEDVRAGWTKEVA